VNEVSINICIKKEILKTEKEKQNETAQS